MSRTEVAESPSIELCAEAIREQLELIVQDPAFRSSKRSIQFLRFVVEKTLAGAADEIKERTIGVEVFGRQPSYDTNEDHVVRTAASDLRRRLALYYGDEKHRLELRVSLVPGSYIPQFKYPVQLVPGAAESDMDAGLAGSLERIQRPAIEPDLVPQVTAAVTEIPAEWNRKKLYAVYAAAVIALFAVMFSGYRLLHPINAQNLFWKPVLDTPGFVLLAAGDVPNGPPTSSTPQSSSEYSIPLVHKTSSPTIPFADAVTMARVLGVLQSQGKKMIIRRESASSFSDLREGPVVLIGAFNNEWSLRLTNQLRYTLALDAERHLIYIRDAKNPSARNWSWATDRPTDNQGGPGNPVLHDYALISRIWNSETGHVVVVIGGLYTYGTETAGEFLTDPELMQAVAKTITSMGAQSNLQIVLETTVTDDAAGPPKVLAVSSE